MTELVLILIVFGAEPISYPMANPDRCLAVVRTINEINAGVPVNQSVHAECVQTVYVVRADA